MTPILLDCIIKGLHFLREISKERLFTKTPPVFHNWDAGGGGGGGGGDLPGRLHVNADWKKRKEKSTLKIN